MPEIETINPLVLDSVSQTFFIESGQVRFSTESNSATATATAQVTTVGMAPLTIRTPSEILAMKFDDSANLVGDWLLAEEQESTMVGPAGAGKSRLVLQMAADQIIGRPFLKFPTRGGGRPWLIFNSENSNRRLQVDLERLRAYCGDRWPIVDANLHFHTLEGPDDSFLSLATVGNEMRAAEVVRNIDPLCVVFDPLSEYGTGDLNRDEDMRASCKAMARVARAGNPKRANLVLHHTVVGRAGAVKAVGYDRGSYGRNSKALLGWTRAQINLAPGSPDNFDVLVVSCGKCSNGREFEPFAIRLNPETFVYEVDADFDLDAWLAEYGGQKESAPRVTVETVRELCKGAMSKKELVRAIQEETGVGKSKAYAMVDKAVSSKRIHYTKATDRYVSKV